MVASGCGAPQAPDRRAPRAGPSSAASSSAAPPSAAPPSSGAPRQAAASVIALSVDGLNPSALTELGPGRLPNFFALIRSGTSTLNARTELESTETLPNHTGMLTGRPIEGPSGHGVDFNTDPGQVTVGSRAGRPIASVLDVVHGADRSTALYASKSKFALYQRSWASSIDRSVIEEDNERLVDRLVADLRSRPAAFTFVHLSAPDIAGHGSGFMGPAYLRAVEQVDGLLGRIRQTVDGSPDLQRRVSLVVTADHGGRGTSGHAAADKLDDYRIPFIVAGPTVKAGSDLYALNTDYRDPGESRPSYAGEQPVRNGNLADVSTELLGLPPVPGSVFGVRHPLDLS